MAATILESLVLRAVSVVTKVAAEERIGSQTDAGLTSALFLSPSYPGNKPSARPWNPNQDASGRRAGRSGSLRSVPASRSLTMRVSGLSLMRKPAPATAGGRMHRGQPSAGALAMRHQGGIGLWPTAIPAIAGARTAAPCEPTAEAFTASTQGRRAVAG
jgi:hypothetical protein